MEEVLTYFRPFQEVHQRVNLRHLPTGVLPGERGLASVEVDGEALIWSMTHTTWRRLQAELSLHKGGLPVDIEVWVDTNPFPKLQFMVL